MQHAHTIPSHGTRHDGQLHHGKPRERVDGSRIAANAGAIAINAVIAMLLMAPLAIPELMEPEPNNETIFEFPTPPPKPKPIEPPIRVEVTHKPNPRPQPIAQPQVTPQPQPVADLPADPMDFAVEPVEHATTEPVASSGIGIDTPLEGAALRYASAPPPTYPIDALREGVTGTVLLEVLVDTDGKPLKVDIAQSSGNRQLDRAARQQVLTRWSFEPAMRDGRLVQAIGMVPVEFTLDR